MLPAVEPGILPGGMGVWFEKSVPLRTSGTGGKMPPSTAAKMAAATYVNPTLNTYATGEQVVVFMLIRCRGLLGLIAIFPAGN